MADANHSVPAVFHDCFVTEEASFRHRRLVPHLRLADRAPPVLYLWTKLSGRWVEAAGFEPGQRLRIEATHRRLVITSLDACGGDAVRASGSPTVDPAMALQQFATVTGEAQ